MALLTILHHPDPRLRKKAVPVKTIDERVRQIVDDMFETMYSETGIGLAATQVNIHERIITIDISESRDQPLCLINPEIIHQEGRFENEEGCLSVPDYFDKVTRAERIRLKALDRDGKPFGMDADELLGICIQHEMDHLDGKLFVDYLSSLKQQRVRKRMEKWEREHAKTAARQSARAAAG